MNYNNPIEFNRTKKIKIGAKYLTNIFQNVITNGYLLNRDSAPSFNSFKDLSNPQIQATNIDISIPPSGSIKLDVR